MKKTYPIVILLASAWMPFSMPSAAAQPVWNHAFRDSSEPSKPFESGKFGPAFQGNNLTLLGYSLEAETYLGNPEEGTGYEVLSLSRFDEAGVNLWNVRLDPAQASNLELFAVGENTGQFFASMREFPQFPAGPSIRFGLFTGADAEPVFAKRITLAPFTAPLHKVTMHNPNRIDVLVNNGPTLDSLVLDGAGETVFNKQYASPLFKDQSSPGIQTVFRDLRPDRKEYLTVVTTSIMAMPGAPGNSGITLIPFFTGLTGNVKQMNSFAFSGRAQGTLAPIKLADGALLYRVLSAEIDMTGSGSMTQRTNLLKVDANGTLAWTKAIDSGLFIAAFPANNAIYLVGSRQEPGGEVGMLDAAVLKLDPATGEILEQLVFARIDDVDMALAFANDSHLFIQIFSANMDDDDSSLQEVQPFTTTLVKTDLNLGNPEAFRYNQHHVEAVLMPDGDLNDSERLIFSAASPLDNEIRAFSLDTNLQPLGDCDLFTPVELGLGEPVTITDLTVTEANPQITATDITTTLEDTTLPVAQYSLSISDACGAMAQTGNVTISLNPAGNGVVLSFPTEAGVEYSINFSSDLNGFSEIGKVTGDGNHATFSTSDGGDRGFFTVSPKPPFGE